MRRCGLSGRTIGFVLLNLFLLLRADLALSQLTVNPSSVNFGSVPTSSSATRSLVLINSGSSNVTVSQATVIGSGFNLSGSTLPLNLAGGQNGTLNLVFAPTSSGSVTGSLSLV